MVHSIHDIHVENARLGRPSISVEFFPPKTDDGDRTLFEKTLPTLKEGRFDYCSVTYGAGGSTREKTLSIVDRIQREFDLTTMMHLTCVNATREQLRSVIDEARSRGVRNILALRGDPPGGMGDWVATEGGFRYSSELVQYLRDLRGFTVGTAGFPEGHVAQLGGNMSIGGICATRLRPGLILS